MPDIPRALLLTPLGPQVSRVESPNRRNQQRTLQKAKMKLWRNECFPVL
jgi:hypothetical protein